MRTYYNNKFFKLHNFSNSSIHVAQHVHDAAAMEKGQFLQFLINMNNLQFLINMNNLQFLIKKNNNHQNINKSHHIVIHNIDDHVGRDQGVACAADDKIADDIKDLQNNINVPKLR